MSKSEIYASFAHSFLWIVIFAVATVDVSSITHLVSFAVMHGNRTHQDVVSMMVAQTPMIGLVAAIGSLLKASPETIVNAFAWLGLRCKLLRPEAL